MIIKTTRFGEIEVDDTSKFTFIDPILGYEDELEFVLIEHKENSSFRWLQSTKSPSLAFLVTVAGFFGIDYTFELPQVAQDDLGIESVDEILVLNIVIIPSEDPKASTINLLAPLIFNVSTRKAAQVILTGTDYIVKHPLFKKEAIC